MPQYQSYPIVHYHIPKPNKEQDSSLQKIKLSFNLWQIFTGITIILTIASLIIYFNDLAPKTKEEGFIWATNNKAIVFNHSQRLLKWFEENKQSGLVGVQLKESCYRDILTHNLDDVSFFENTRDTLNSYKRLTDELTLNYNQLNEEIIKRSPFEEYLNAVEEYQNRLGLYFERQEIYRTNTLNIQKKAVEVCISDFDSLESKVSELELLVNEFPLNSLPEYETWLEKVEKFIQVVRSLIEEIKNQAFIKSQQSEVIEGIRQNYIAIFQISFFTETELTEIENLYNLVDEKLTALEDWEQVYVRENQSSQNFLLLINKE